MDYLNLKFIEDKTLQEEIVHIKEIVNKSTFQAFPDSIPILELNYGKYCPQITVEEFLKSSLVNVKIRVAQKISIKLFSTTIFMVKTILDSYSQDINCFIEEYADSEVCVNFTFRKLGDELGYDLKDISDLEPTPNNPFFLEKYDEQVIDRVFTQLALNNEVFPLVELNSRKGKDQNMPFCRYLVGKMIASYTEKQIFTISENYWKLHNQLYEFYNTKKDLSQEILATRNKMHRCKDWLLSLLHDDNSVDDFLFNFNERYRISVKELSLK